MDPLQNTETFFAVTSTNRKLDVDDMVLYEDTKVSFSERYTRYLSHNLSLRFIPAITDFKYLKQVEVYTDKVFIARQAKDIVSGVIAKDGTIDLDKLNKKTNKKYYGYIILAPLLTTKYPNYLPHFSFTDVSKCIKKITMAMKQENKSTSWISQEPCTTLARNQCVVSDTCVWNNKGCSTYPPLMERPLQKLNAVMKPYKYYMFSEFQVNEPGVAFELSKGRITIKPPGLWFAVGDEWLQHLKKTHFWMNKYKYLYEIEIDTNQLKVIDNMKALQEFSMSYGVHETSPKTTYTLNVDWYKFSNKTKSAGLIISPNFKRLHKKYSSFNNVMDVFSGSEWYLNWDIASGVIWDRKAIKSLTLVYTKEPGHFVPYKNYTK